MTPHEVKRLLSQQMTQLTKGGDSLQNDRKSLPVVHLTVFISRILENRKLEEEEEDIPIPPQKA